jgi:hypothetical protein
MPHWPVERRRLLSCLNLTTLTWVLDFDFLIDDLIESLDEIGRISDWVIRLLVSLLRKDGHFRQYHLSRPADIESTVLPGSATGFIVREAAVTYEGYCKRVVNSYAKICPSYELPLCVTR